MTQWAITGCDRATATEDLVP